MKWEKITEVQKGTRKRKAKYSNFMYLGLTNDI